jgi:tetratricopeptide (TPR) repeat protein
MKKEYIIGIGVIVVVAAAIFAGTSISKARARSDEAGRIADISNSKNAQTIDDLKKTIAQYDKQLDSFIKASGKTGTYWKILATRLQDKGQYGEALDALENAIKYNPEDAALFYMTGVSAATMAKSDLNFPGKAGTSREEYFRVSEQGYLRAIELKNDYDKPLYGIGVLYVFELNKAEEAIPYLQRYCDLNARNPEGRADGMFVLARAYFITGDYTSAINEYNAIMTTSRSKNKQAQAETLKQQVVGVMNG